ncbi:MAG: hypothetical protein H7841_01780 [Magnetospirillum sp. WYHS-4]
MGFFMRPENKLVIRVISAWGALAVAFCCLFALTALSERDAVLSRAEAKVRDLTLVAATHASHVFESTNVALMATVDRLGKSPDWNRVEADREVWENLKSWATSLSFVPRILAIDGNGTMAPPCLWGPLSSAK